MSLTGVIQRCRVGWATPYGLNPVALVALALTSIWRGETYADGIPPGSVPPVELVSGFVPMGVWPWIWMLVGTIMLAGIVVRRLFTIGASAVAVMWCLWGIAFFWAWLSPHADASSSAGLTGATFFVLGLCTWSLASDEIEYDQWQAREHAESGGAGV